MSIRLFNNSGGYIDLNAGGDGTAANTFTLPAETGTLLTSASSLDATTLTGNVAASRIITALNATGSAPFYACRAWVNFNGTGTVAIREDGNVSSITDNNTGNYTVNFTTNMSDVNYAAIATCQHQNGVTTDAIISGANFSISASAVQFFTVAAGSSFDSDTINVAIFR